MASEVIQAQARVDNIKPVELLEALRQEKYPSIESSNSQALDTLLYDRERWSLLLKMSSLAIESSCLVDNFSGVDRIPRRKNGDRETDVEHSFLLATLAPNLARILYPNLDIDRIRHYSLVHDMIEIEVGDVATFNLSPDEQAEKERREQIALKKLLKELPLLEAEALASYERQDTPEARFVRLVDKLLPAVVDITGQGTRVVEEDFGVASIDELRSSHDKLAIKWRDMFHNEFPELEQLYAVLAYLFENKYEQERQRQKETHIPERPNQLKEVERKWLIDPDNLPDGLENYPHADLKQGYLAVSGDGSETRIRSFGDGERFELTVKTAGTVVRGEQNIKITGEMFKALWPQTEGNRVEKTRYYIPFTDSNNNQHTIELDVYAGHLSGLATAEIEFSGRETEASVRANTFTPPKWFGDDVSEDKRYKNRSLASMQHGFMKLG